MRALDSVDFEFDSADIFKVCLQVNDLRGAVQQNEASRLDLDTSQAQQQAIEWIEKALEKVGREGDLWKSMPTSATPCELLWRE